MAHIKCIIVLCLLLSSPAYGNSHDHGKLLADSKFSTTCLLNDIGISGNIIVKSYSNGQIECSKLQDIYSKTFIHAANFFALKKQRFIQSAPNKVLTIRVITLADLNNPDNFSQTDARCMYNIECASGAFFGRTFHPNSSNINIYIAYPRRQPSNWKYYFTSTVKHELMHVILYRYPWDQYLNANEEHILISEFLIWERKQKQ